jgi:hypothetical protein
MMVCQFEGMMRQITLTGVPLPPFKPMGQLRLGVVRVLEAQIRTPIGLKGGKGTPVRVIWRIIPPTKIITGTRVIHLSKTPLFYCFIYCFLPRFIQLMTPLLPLKPMAQSRRGVRICASKTRTTPSRN